MAPIPDTNTLHQRNIFFLQTPRLWPLWPLLPLVKRHLDGSETLGVLIDVQGIGGNDPLAWTVFLDNLFFLATKLSQLQGVPREAFSSPEELFASGWRVD